MEQRDSLLPLLQVAHVKCRDRRQLLRAASLLPPPPRGCVLFHINDKERSGSKKSLSYTNLFKKNPAHNTVGRSPQESSESRRGMTKDRNNLTSFFSTKQGLQSFRAPFVFYQKPKTGFMHFNGGAFPHRERGTTVQSSHLSAVKSLKQRQLIFFLLPPLG